MRRGWYLEGSYQYMGGTKKEFVDSMSTFMLVDALEQGYEKNEIIPLTEFLELMADAIDAGDTSILKLTLKYTRGIIDEGEPFYTCKHAYLWENGDEE